MFRFGRSKVIKDLSRAAEYIEGLSVDTQRLSDAQLRGKADEFRARVRGGEALENLCQEAFAVACEAAVRTIGQPPTAVQLMGGLALHFGNVVEMAGGEGKTLSVALSAFLNALSGQGVHVAVNNDYLARRDAETMGPVYRFLGLRVGLIVPELSVSEQREAYRADITYGAADAFAYDYLRDNMTWTINDRVQRGRHHAIVDDVDAVLIDDARASLYIKGPEDDADKTGSRVLACIALPSYFRLYHGIAVTAGIARTDAAELRRKHRMDVVSIPTGKPVIREDHADVIYQTEPNKFAAVAADIAARHEKGQPVLAETTSAEKSEYLSRLMHTRGVPHNVLNGVHHEREAAIAAEAGRIGAVTVVTNMAGRGIDIMLGGNPVYMAVQELRERGLAADAVETREAYGAAWHETLVRCRERAAVEAEEVRLAGGLYVVGTELHEARRVDDQLRGRCGRRGDPGESRFYLSLDDELMRLRDDPAVRALLRQRDLAEDRPVTLAVVAKWVNRAQADVERVILDRRMRALAYHGVLDRHREIVYNLRYGILSSLSAPVGLRDQVGQMLEEVIEAYIDGATANRRVEDWDLDGLWTALGTLYPISIRWQSPLSASGAANKEARLGEPTRLSRELLLMVLADARAAYRRREAEVDELIAERGGMRELERQILLQVLDRAWREHLDEMGQSFRGKWFEKGTPNQHGAWAEYEHQSLEKLHERLAGFQASAIGYLFNVIVTSPSTQDG